MKKFIALLLLASLLTSCGQTGTPNETDEQTESDTTTAAKEPDRLDELGNKNFGGRTFTILDANSNPDMHVNMPGDSMNGDIVNDALYERDAAISDRFNINIEYVSSSDAKTGTTALKNSVLAGDDEYTICISCLLGGALATTALEGVLANLCDNEYLSLSESWWSPLLYDQLRLGNIMYFTAGDISPAMYQMPNCLFMNTKLAENYGVNRDDICQLVRDGKWTYDEVYNITKDRSKDVNDDGVMAAADDFFGLVHQKLGGFTTTALLVGAGVELSAISPDGNSLSVDLVSERNIDAIEKVKRVLEDVSYNGWQEQNDVINKTFKGDNAILLLHVLESASVHLRDMQSDYLVLPMPKYNADQENYHSQISGWVSSYVAIPLTSDPEFAGMITEALDYYSYKYIRPKAYDLTYKQKTSRDENSAEMLDIIFSTLYLDFNCLYDFGGTASVLTNALNGTGSLASDFAAIQGKIDSGINSFTENWIRDDK